MTRSCKRTERDVDVSTDGEVGSGSLLALAIIGATIASLALGVPLLIGIGIRESVATAADAAALAGADVAAGIYPGSPCAVAASVAIANRARLASCRVDGLVVTVRASADFLGLHLASEATAGPPVAGTN
jgi:secretion/DNA translocation related TadE-like protein